MKHIKYPKTNQFRDVYNNLKRKFDYQGNDVDGNPIYIEPTKYPTVPFRFTTKIHGTQGSIVCWPDGSIVAQSRSNKLVTITGDETIIHGNNAGFGDFVIATHHIWNSVSGFGVDEPDNKIVTIYGEWAGKGIQKGVGVSELDKFFMIFGIKFSEEGDGDLSSTWADNDEVYEYYKTYQQHFNDVRIYHAMDFGVWDIDVDFNNPKEAQDKIMELTLQIEEECPVAIQLAKLQGIPLTNTVGEGVVGIHIDKQGDRHCFKSKGEAHSSSKVGKMKVVDIDPEKMSSIQEFIDYACTDNRMEQGLQEVFGIGNPIERNKLGDYIKWVVNDIRIEEANVLANSGLEMKDVGKYMSNKIRNYFFAKEKM